MSSDDGRTQDLLGATRPEPFELGGWHVEPDRNRLVSGDREIRLRVKTMEVLIYLAGRMGEVVSHDELIGAVWKGREVTNDVLKVSVYELRKALGDSSREPRFIETVPGRGYGCMPAATASRREPPAAAALSIPPGPRTAISSPSARPAAARRCSSGSSAPTAARPGASPRATRTWDPTAGRRTAARSPSSAPTRRAPRGFEAEKAKDDARVVDRDFRFRHLYRVAVAAAPAPDLPEPRRVTAGAFHVETFDWSPDGRRFVLSHVPTPRIFEWRESDLATVAADGGEPEPLVRHPGMDTGPRFSPDGKTVAFVSDRGHRTWARDWRICRVPADGGEVTELAPTGDGMPGESLDAGLVAWAADGSGVYYSEFQGTSTQLFFLPADGGAWRRITRGPGAKWNFDSAAGLMAYVGEDFERPQEVWVEPLAGGGARAVTSVHGGLPPLPAARSEEVRWKSFDGLEIEGILHLPPGHRDGRRLPLIVNLHGGPTWAFLREYALPSRLIAGRGFAVLQVNPRGSTGYGRDFRLANLGDWGGADVQDVLAGVDHAVALGVADPDRLGVFGASYGGFLTGMTIARSRRFKAAIVEIGPTHLVSFAGTTDIPGFIPSFLQSELWEAADLWRDRSAVYHAGKITTPTLLLYGEHDERVPLGQGYELYRALERAGVPTEMVVYPRSGHGVTEPKLWLDQVRRELAWFERWLLGDS